MGLSRVDVRDIAEAAAIALTSSGNDGRTVNLVGPEVHTGDVDGGDLGQRPRPEDRVRGDDLDAWEKQSLTTLPPLLVFDLRLMYAFFQERGLKATPEDVERQTALLGHAPRRFDAFAAETARAWSV